MSGGIFPDQLKTEKFARIYKKLKKAALGT
jgi:hypothetical protein